MYGLGADATNAGALDRLYQVKGRPRAHPLIVHVRGTEDIAHWTREAPEAACRLARAFWPGPLTLVLKRAPSVLDAVTGGQDTVALRVPGHPLAQSLLAAFGEGRPDAGPVGIAAPSANRYGKVSPTTAQHVAADLGAEVDLILDGGPCDVGIESTIVDLSAEHVAILRPGRITAAQIEQVLDAPLAPPGEERPKTPGTHASHYATRARLRLVTRRQMIDALAANRGRRIAVLALEVSVPRLPAALCAVVPVVPAQYERTLYANLRALDATGVELILVETPPDTAAWAGVRDRLFRAAAR